MNIYTLERSQEVAAPLGEVWDFFSNPENLALITPPWLGFRIISGGGQKIYEGMIIKYSVSPLFGIPLTWVTEITEVEEQSRFVDEQRRGPYKLWRHEHVFKEKGGAVEVKDVVSYALPLGPLGRAVHAVDTKKRLCRIFDFRQDYVRRRFGAASRNRG
ncbi:MAG: SRPBCC family protein [Candidatus Dadabacteria bacterium]|nr:SRPBCC family protein [Candidatus Dadabacteria bacterium]